MPQSSKSGRKREPQSSPSLRRNAVADPSPRICAQCAAKVARSECHRNRYGQYICLTCLAKLRPSGLPLAKANASIGQHVAAEPVNAGQSRRIPKHRAHKPTTWRPFRRNLPSARPVAPEQFLHAAFNALILLFVIVVVWVIWTQL